MQRETIKARSSENFIKGLAAGEKERLVSDEGMANHYLVISPAGKKTWRWQTKLKSGVPRKIAIGPFPFVSLATARAQAEIMNGQRAMGLDPKAEIERQAHSAKAIAAANATNSVEKVFEKWVEWKKDSEKPATKSIHEYKRIMRLNFMPEYGARPIAEITKADIKAAMEVMRVRGARAQANRFLNVLRPFFRWALFEDFVVVDPTATIMKFGEPKPSERVLDVAEMALAYRAADALPTDQRDALRILILCGTRKIAACAARSADYDADGIWTLKVADYTDDRGHTYPVSHSKTDREHHMLLPPLAKAIFEARKERKDKDGKDSDFLFHDAPHKFMWPDLARDADAEMTKLNGGQAVAPWSIHKIKKGVRTALSSNEMHEMLEREGEGLTFSENIGEIVTQHSLGSLNKRYNKSTYARVVGRALMAWERLLIETVGRQERNDPVEIMAYRRAVMLIEDAAVDEKLAA
jgi:integrase